MSWLVGLVNEYAAVPRAVAGEEALPLPDLALPAPAGNLHLHVDREQLLQLADELHAVFAAAHRGGEDFVRALNAILLRTRPWPHLGAGEIVWTAGGTHGRHDPHLQALTAGSALALLGLPVPVRPTTARAVRRRPVRRRLRRRVRGRTVTLLLPRMLKPAQGRSSPLTASTCSAVRSDVATVPLATAAGLAMATARTDHLAVACCDRTGTERGQTWTSGTAIVGADGWVLAETLQATEVSADIDLLASRQKALASQAYLLDDRHPQLYRRLTRPSSSAGLSASGIAFATDRGHDSCSRNANFCTLPVEVLGSSSTNSTESGTL